MTIDPQNIIKERLGEIEKKLLRLANHPDIIEPKPVVNPIEPPQPSTEGPDKDGGPTPQ